MPSQPPRTTVATTVENRVPYPLPRSSRAQAIASTAGNSTPAFSALNAAIVAAVVYLAQGIQDCAPILARPHLCGPGCRVPVLSCCSCWRVCQRLRRPIRPTRCRRVSRSWLPSTTLAKT